MKKVIKIFVFLEYFTYICVNNVIKKNSMTTKEAIRKIKKVHGDKYELKSDWEYKNAKSDIELFCHKHGVFHKDFYRLVNLKQGCPTCSYGKKYKPFGYWNNKENCENEVKKYNGKYELQRKSEGCYNSCLRNGWMDEFAEKYFDNRIKYMKYDEKINLVYVYEYAELNSCYVGRTNMMKRRDRQHRNGHGHSNGLRTYDVVYNFAKENGVKIPEPKILEENLTAEESQDMEDYWKTHYAKNGWNILNKGVTGIGKGSLGATLKWTYEACKEEAGKYSCKYEMKLKNQSAYSSSVQNGWINDFFENKKKEDHYWDNLENVLEAARKSSGAKDMIRKFGGAYNSARKHNWTNLLKYGENT
jgi:predicted GIY-YIG superfamily endonuclease